MHHDHYNGRLFSDPPANLALLTIVVIAVAVPVFLFYFL
jgi:hypothetical protein